ncbi:MAG TPA: PorP/SprF family type IX secretion system membrane protein [Ohtaekwangia sp.]|nr:PorP/SprF family type IX secretion system membrane protein [Ohtaekwangia sp.]
MKRILALVFAIVSVQYCAGQTPAPFRQFFFNPYLFNPGYTGINGYSELYLVYRQQWVDFKDAPTTMGVNFQYPTKKRVSLGFSIVSDEVVALRNTSFTSTFAYAVPIAANQALRFGISGGVGMNDLNLKEGEYDPNDPTIINAAQNNFYVDGNFGAVYTNRGFRLGFALTRLFDTNGFSSKDFNEVEFSALDNRLYSVSYRFPVGAGGISLEPYFLYRESVDKLNAWEAASTVYFREKLWVGASYHETLGLGFFLGASIKDLFRFSYSYELPPMEKNFISSSSHELHMSLRLGKKKTPDVIITSRKTRAPAIDSTLIARGDEEPVEEGAVEEEGLDENLPAPNALKADNTTNTDPIQNDPLPPTVTPATTASTIQPREAAVTEVAPVKADSSAVAAPPAKKTGRPARSFALAPGHYVVAGAFRIMDNAIRYSQELHGKGYGDATIAINPKNNLYYVYIFSSYDLDEARKIRNQYRVRRPFHEVWLFTME